MKYLEEHPEFSFAGYKEFRNIYGVLIPPDHATDFEAALMSHPVVKEKGATGAMHQAVVGHLRAIKASGYDAWLSEFPTNRRYQFDGTQASVPVTDISREMDKDE